MAVKTEQQTRKDLINPLLEKAGWRLKDRTKLVEEVDTKQSDFSRRDYRTVDETLKNDADSAYVDYLLLDSTGAPLAIVEAKRTSRDPVVGQQQAEMYADDINRQTNQDLFVFLTNGYEIWFWNRPFESLRMIKGFHSREALERVRFQNVSMKPFHDVPISPRIVDRPYQIEAVKRVLEGIEKGKRKFLIVHATGTGKTRVAMALIDVLLRASRAQKVLFLADRKALRTQAYNEGFKVYFPNELKTIVFAGKLEKNKRLFASTIQTFQDMLERLYGDGARTGYRFDAVPINVLGQAYELYIGSVIVEKTGVAKGVEIVEDYKKRQEHGIYYTPTLVTHFIVRQTLGEILKNARAGDEVRTAAITSKTQHSQCGRDCRARTVHRT
ncbi:MAG: DEAD/DEAH box helicase family protein [Candidatus Bathyarchaeia archaeon]